MKYAFVIAMPNESETVIGNLTEKTETKLFGRRVVTGKLHGEETAVVVAGIGKSNAAASAQLAISAFSPETVFNVGVAGGLDKAMQVGDFYEIESAVQYDFNLSMINHTEIGTLNERKTPHIPCKVTGEFPPRILATADRFTDGNDTLLLKRLGCTVCDMEGAAIAHVCETAGVGFRSLKCISDVVGSGSQASQYMINLAKCLTKLTEYFAVSPAAPEVFEWRYAPTMDDLARATEDLRGAVADVPAKEQMTIMIAADEIFANIVRHSCANDWTLRVEKSKKPKSVKLIFTDDGKPFDPLAERDPDTTLDATDRMIGGLGIFIVKKTMSPVTYLRENGRNVLSIGLTY